MSTTTPACCVGVDLDATLAVHHGWVPHNHIGPPIPSMVERVKKLLRDGHLVWIYTARLNADPELIPEIEDAIREYCRTHIGKELPMTGRKELFFNYMLCDRSIGVVANTGLTTIELLRQSLVHVHGSDNDFMRSFEDIVSRHNLI